MSVKDAGDLAAAVDEVVDAHQLLERTGVLSHSGHGNLSRRLGGGRMLLASVGPLRRHGAKALATVTFDGVVEDGQLDAPTREIVGMHAVAYETRPDVRAVVHTHSPSVTAFALAHRPLPCRYEALLRQRQSTDVPVVPWAPRGSAASVDGIARALRSASTTLAVLLANHGLLAFGPTPVAAVRLVVALEEAAAAEIAAACLGGSQALPAGAFDDVVASMERGRGSDDGDGKPPAWSS